MAVRRESVRLDVEGNFARGILEDAAAVDVLRHQLKDLSGQSVQSSRATKDLERDIDKTGQTARRSSKDLDTYTGRLGLLASAIGAVAPAAGPIGAVGIGGIAGIANDAGAATLALGSLVVAAHGVAPALKAVNKAALEPTTANLQAARLAMEQLSPAARSFVKEFQGIEPVLHRVQAAAASGWFHGLTEALHELMPLAPVIEKIFHDIGKAGGDLAAQGAKSLAGPQWHDFFQFVDTQMPKALTALGHVIGSLTHGLAELWMAFQPLNNSFNDWLVKSAHSFDQWATGLSKTQGFHDFIAYVDQNGPKVAAAFSAIASAVVQITQAAAPLGGPTLQALTAIARILAAIANSPLGTPIMAMIQLASVAALLGRAMSGIKTSAATMSAALDGSAASMMKAKVGAVALVAELLLIAGASGGASGALDNFNTAIQTQNIDAAKKSLADLQAKLVEWQTLRGESGGFWGGLGTIVTHPLDSLNFTGSDMFGSGESGLKNQIKVAESQLKDLQRNHGSATAQIRSANRQTADSFVNLAQAMQKPTLSLDHLVARWKNQAAAEAALGKNITAAIAKGANPEALTKIIDQLGPQAGLAIQQLARGGKKDIAELNAAFHTGQHAANVYNGALGTLTNTMLGIPHTVTSKVQVDGITKAINGIDYLRQQMSHPITQVVNVVRNGQHVQINPTAGGPNVNPLAPGGHALGGTIPKDGRPYADRYLTLLAPGEEVISNRNGQADRHRALLKAINAGRMANGGTVGRSYGGSSTVRHVIEVKVTGEMDLQRATAQIHEVARKVSTVVARDEIGQQSVFDERYGG